MTHPIHIVVIPAHNEEAHLPGLLESLVRQTRPPDGVIVIDDRSTDRTAAIVDEAAAAHPWIRRRAAIDSGGRVLGGKVARLFLQGAAEAPADWAFLSKIDADLTLPDDYFEQLFERFDAAPRLGLAGGGCWEWRGGRLHLEKVPPDHTRGALKTYRRACWDEMGGVRPVDGWDGIDGLTAQMHGWETRSFPELQVVHHRPTGSAGGVIRGRLKAGRFAHFMGYHPLFMAVRSARRMLDRPYLVGGLALGAGYLQAWAAKAPRLPEPDVRAFLRDKQLRRMGLRRGR